MNIQEDYVSFETAKLLKEKGFNVLCYGRYSVRSKELHLDTTRPYNNGGIYHYSAPTLQMAMKWLREVHLILYTIYHSLESGELRFLWRIEKLEQDKKHYVEELPGIEEYYKDSDESFTTYKEAEESLIKYCLENLI